MDNLRDSEYERYTEPQEDFIKTIALTLLLSFIAALIAISLIAIAIAI